MRVPNGKHMKRKGNVLQKGRTNHAQRLLIKNRREYRQYKTEHRSRSSQIVLSYERNNRGDIFFAQLLDACHDVLLSIDVRCSYGAHISIRQYSPQNLKNKKGRVAKYAKKKHTGQLRRELADVPFLR